MFEPPDTRTIRRSELASSSQGSASSRSLSPVTLAEQHSKLASYFSNPDHQSDQRSPESETFHTPKTAQDVSSLEETEQDVHPFRLFSSTITTSTAPRIRVASPPLGPGSIIYPRPSNYYFHTPAGGKDTYQLAAISGEDVKRHSLTPWPGTALPWRLNTIQLPLSNIVKLDTTPPVGTGIATGAPCTNEARQPAKKSKKSKPNKKRRVEIRTRTRNAIETEAKVKEEAEKRKREKNRAKNKRKAEKSKAKAKAAKMAIAEARAAEPETQKEGSIVTSTTTTNETVHPTLEEVPIRL